MLRGPLDWFTADSEHAGLKVGDLRELVERFPEGEELEWYVNFGKKLSRTDPAIRVRLEEVAKIRTQVIAKLRELRAAQTKNSSNLSKSTKQG